MKKLIIILSLIIFGISYVVADSDRYYDDERYKKRDKHQKRDYKQKGKYRKSNLSNNQLYIDECGSCHMAYQVEFLPKRSWNKMMDNLDDHFKVDATIEKSEDTEIRAYLNKNASDTKRTYGEIEEFSDSIRRNSTLLEISKIPKFIREHDEVPQKFISQREVKTISNCTACHLDAKDGLYKERNIMIPNYGRWDD